MAKKAGTTDFDKGRLIPRMLNLDDIELDGDWQPDQQMTTSLAAVGTVLQPVIVLPRNKDLKFPIADGRRRVAAARFLEWTQIFALIAQDELAAQAAMITLAANSGSPNRLSEARALDVLDDPRLG